MVKATPALTSSLETMTSRGTYNKQLRRGAKRRQSSSSKSGSDDSGTNPNDVVERISTSRPVSPKASVEVSEDHISRTIPEGGWPGSSSQRKTDIELDIKYPPPSSLAINEPPYVNPRGKDPCKSGKCKFQRDRSSDILRQHLQKYPYNIIVGGSDAARRKRKDTSKKYYASDTSISAGNSLTEREGKRLKTELKGSAADNSFDTLLLKVEEVSSKMKGPHDAIISPKRRSISKQGSKRTKSTNHSRSINSRSTYSRKSSGKSSGRSSARSIESMDGHTELLESLVHAAHAEDKLHKDKENLQRELQELEKRNEELEQELNHTLKVVDRLRKKYRYASRDRHDMKKRLYSEKAKWENDLQTTLKQEQISLSKERDKSAPIQKH